MFNKSDIKRNEFQLFGGQAKKGYDWFKQKFGKDADKVDDKDLANGKDSKIDNDTPEGATQNIVNGIATTAVNAYTTLKSGLSSTGEFFGKIINGFKNIKEKTKDEVIEILKESL